MDAKFKLLSGTFFGLLMFVMLTLSAPAQSSFESGLTLYKKESTTGMGRNSEGTSTVYFSKNIVRQNGSDGNDFLLFFDHRKFVTIDHNKKTYSELTFDELEAKLNQLSARAQNLDNPQARAMLEKMMGAKFGEVSVTKEGPGGEIAGFDTDKYTIVVAPLNIEVWAAPDLEVPELYYDTLKLRAPANPMFDMGKMFEAMKEIKGMSLKTQTTFSMMGRTSTTITEVTRVEEGAIPASTFEIPSEYKKIDLELD